MEKIHNWVAMIGDIWNEIASLHAAGVRGDSHFDKDKILRLLNSHSANMKQRYNIEEWNDGWWYFFDLVHDQTMGARDLLSYIENKLIATDSDGRKFIAKSILRDLRWMLEEDESEHNKEVVPQLKELVLDNDLFNFMNNIHATMRYFAGYFSVICSDLSIDVAKIAQYTISTQTIDSHKEAFLVSTIKIGDKQYSTLPRTHAIAAVNGLLEKLGVHRSIDRVKIAEFIEAVTGGNIEVAGKDTVSYKQPTENAQAAAAELLKKINL